MRTYSKYLTFFIALSLLIMSCLGYIFDPWGYFRSKGLRPSYFLLSNRTWINEDDRKAIKLTIADQNPQTLIAGNSRVKWGFDVEDPNIKIFTREAYNLGIPGASIEELSDHIEILLPKPALKTVVIGLDFAQFAIRSDEMPHIKFREFGFLNKIKSLIWSKATFKIIRSSLKNPYERTISGTSNPAIEQLKVDEFGHQILTQLFEKKNYSEISFNRKYSADNRKMKVMDSLIGNICRKNLEVKLFISPTHVRQLAILKIFGDFRNFLQWKTDLVWMVNSYNRLGCKISLTDFSRITEITTEKFPEKGDKKYVMKWYWESSHYKSSLGLMIIKSLWKDESSRNFGTELTIKNFKSEGRKSDLEFQQYVKTNPNLLNEIRDELKSEN